MTRHPNGTTITVTFHDHTITGRITTQDHNSIDIRITEGQDQDEVFTLYDTEQTNGAATVSAPDPTADREAA